jgi:hypothetical protein
MPNECNSQLLDALVGNLHYLLGLREASSDLQGFQLGPWRGGAMLNQLLPSVWRYKAPGDRGEAVR